MFAERYQVCQPLSGAAVNTYWALGAYSNSTPTFALDKQPTPTPPTATGANSQVINQFVPRSPVAATGVVAGATGGTSPPSYSIFTTAAVAAPGGFQVAPRGTVYCDPRIPQTPHTGGMLVCLGDASCRVVAANISPITFWSNVTPSGNEIQGADW